MLSWKLAALVCFPLLAGCGKRTVCTTVNRCAVDASVGKIGVRTTCSEGSL